MTDAPRRGGRRSAVVVAIVLALLAGGGWAAWQAKQPKGPGAGFASGNGRIEATEVDLATKQPGRVAEILVDEGAFVKAGQVLATMDVATLERQRDEARAMLEQARTNVAAAQAQVAVRESDRAAAQAQVAQRETERDAAQRRLERSQRLAGSGAASQQETDDDRARLRSAEAAINAARAQVAAAQAAIEAANAQRLGARSAVTAAEATLARIDAEIADARLKAPRDGRVQYVVAQPGEVLGAGGKVLNLIDVADVFMTFFMPERIAGRITLGDDVRVILDAAPGYVIPAKVSFVAASAQFTPKTVETASEREKLMFRVKARIDRDLLLAYQERVKTGLPGIAWIRVDRGVEWPPELTVNVGR